MTPSDPKGLLSPVMRGVIERMEKAARPPLHSMSAVQARLAYAQGAGVLDIPLRQLPRIEDLTLPARDGHALPVRLVAPAASLTRLADGPNATSAVTAVDRALPVLVYFHGGGFTIGGIDTHDALCRELAFLAGCAVISVDYRLAPEHAFPTAHNDAWDALQQIGARAPSWGLDPHRIAVGGDSAGGTLAAVCAVLARDAGLPLALQLLFYPGCAAHQDTPSHQRFASGFVLDEAAIDWFFAQTLPNRSKRVDWRFSPLNAPDVDAVAGAWIGLAECDPLVDEGILYADKLRAAGVAVDLEIYRGVVHEFIKMGRAIPQARQAHADAARALRRAFNMEDNIT